jgi:hypothetical protein
MISRTMMVLAVILAASTAQAEVIVKTFAPGAVSPPAKIQDVAWLEGTWVGQGLGGETTEAYSAPLAGTIVGYFRFVKDGKPVFYEIVTVVEEGDSIVMRLKHFNPDLTGWEEKDESQTFKLVALDGQTAYFDGLTLQRRGEALHGAVQIQREDGSKSVEQFSYRLKK